MANAFSLGSLDAGIFSKLGWSVCRANEGSCEHASWFKLVH